MSTMNSAQYVYYGPSDTLYEQAGSVSSGESVTAIWKEGTWCYIQYQVSGTTTYKRGYVPTSKITITESISTNTWTAVSRYVQNACSVYFGPSPSIHPAAGSFAYGDSVGYLGFKEKNYAFVEYTIDGSTKKKRGWVYANNLALSLPVLTWRYTEGTIINEAGDYWHVTQKWNGSNGHLGFDVVRRNSSDVKVTGAEVYAVADGTVVSTGYNSSNGYVVVLQHTTTTGKTYYSVYGHLDSYTDATSVSQGDVVGIMGDTGDASTAEHLHLGITKNQPSAGFLGYSRDSAGNKTTFTETGAGYKDNGNRYYSPELYFEQGDSFISNNYT